MTWKRRLAWSILLAPVIAVVAGLIGWLGILGFLLGVGQALLGALALLVLIALYFGMRWVVEWAVDEVTKEKP